MFADKLGHPAKGNVEELVAYTLRNVIQPVMHSSTYRVASSSSISMLGGIMNFDLEAMLPQLLPGAISWAELQSRKAALGGKSLSEAEKTMAMAVGVRHPDLVRVMLVDRLPLPDDSFLREAAIQTGLLGPHMVGVTLGHSILIVRGALSSRLLSHEYRHVHQYEEYGSIGAFLTVYLHQIASVGYYDAPLEQDARVHER